jgi:hypothetical protein
MHGGQKFAYILSRALIEQEHCREASFALVEHCDNKPIQV